MHKLTVFFAVITQVLCEGCPHIPTYNLTVYKTVDSGPENVTSAGKIQLKEDAFHLVLANESIPRLCEDSVELKNELSVVQILNCSVADIDPGALRITPTLTLLRISSNALTTVKRGVFNSVRVKEINLSNNFISVVEDEAFDNNTHLEILKMNYNVIKVISPHWFTNSPNVYKLSIIYNDMTKIPARAFRNLARRRPLKLRLSANRINEIDSGAFEGAGDIDILRLNGNKLTTLPSQLFANRTVRILQVNTNRLVCFPEEMSDSKLESLWFLENPTFNCTCLRKVKEFVDENNVDIMYPSVICEDRVREINLVFNFNKTYEIPLLPPTI
ncbi:slit homolog 3 protein-like [Anoplophora glabripennis]|uniref:slit homolog 3 protein-like n=1 Tax=Anoplophora glabripennis TaxID=217634 RepID=UPI0008757F21|nr:slit homolog 3 protein-like [Anoplophora glabripennis]